MEIDDKTPFPLRDLMTVRDHDETFYWKDKPLRKCSREDIVEIIEHIVVSDHYVIDSTTKIKKLGKNEVRKIVTQVMEEYDRKLMSLFTDPPADPKEYPKPWSKIIV